MRIVSVPQLADNYGYLIIDEAAGVAGIVDVAEADTVIAAAEAEGVRIVAILSTHHHFDHVGGNDDLIAKLNDPALAVFGSAEEASQIPGITGPLADGDTFTVGALKGSAMLIPAHTRGHIAYHFEDEGVVFTGDTLFAGGCGRLFEGDAPQMMASLQKLAGLPDETRVYFGHEYTQSNLNFAAELEPLNAALQRRRAEVDELLLAGKTSVPTTITIEKATNPFLRSDSAELADAVRAKMPDTGAAAVDVFAATRLLKDNY